MSKSMVLTLGHNASAIVVEDGNILGGYEEERFSNMKSDSSFPIQSISRLCNMYGRDFDDVCVGHWFTAGLLTNNKYFDMNVIKSLSPNVHSISEGLTHHDSHLLSAKVFADHYNFPKSHLAIVADGFGTFGECISIYSSTKLGHLLLARYFGYGKSLGMLYQYATAYLGMKMHNHEYKMLGYEAHICEALELQKIIALDDIIASDARKRVKAFYNEPVERDTDPIVNKGALAAAQHEITNLLDSVIERLEETSLNIYTKRIIIAYYVQGIVEAVIGSIVDLHKPESLLVSGGLFYNVKLNHLLADKVDNFCAMPLAGDQGAGLGIYQGIHGDLKWPGHVAWGHRDLSEVEQSDTLIVVDSEDEAFEIMSNELDVHKMVNLVRGSMEFGPRSLCNTATIAIPDMYTVEKINRMNDRTTVMPMAPAMTLAQSQHMLKDTHKVYGSLDYMIVTRDVEPNYTDSMRGASHFYELNGRHTCRPQVVRNDDDLMNDMLNEYGPLINTSFNYHGVPIVFDKQSVEYSHKKQNEQFHIKTVVIAEE